MKKSIVVLSLFVCIMPFSIKAEIQLSYKGPYFFRVHQKDFFYMLGIGPILKRKLNNELYFVGKTQPMDLEGDSFNYYGLQVMSGELQLMVKKNNNWTVGPVAGIYVVGKKNSATFDGRRLKYYNRIGAVGIGAMVRYSTESDVHCIFKGTVSGSTGSLVRFPIELNAKDEDVDYYDSLHIGNPVYKSDFIDQLARYEEEHEIFAVPCIVSLSVHKYLGYLACAAGIESKIVPYFPKDKGRYKGVYYKVAGYISLGLRILKKKNPSTPFMF